MSKRRFVATAIALGLGAVSAQSLSIFAGGGARVFDQANYEQALDRYQRMQEQLDVMTEELELQTWLAQQLPVDLNQRYQAVPTPWLRSTPPSDTYGKLGPWSAAINRGADPRGAYGLVTEELEPYDSTALDEPGSVPDRRKRWFADVELHDGSNLHTLNHERRESAWE